MRSEKKKTDYADVFEWMGVSLNLNGSKERRADECPYCSKSKFYVNSDKGLFHCKTCEARGNLTEFLTDQHKKLLAQTTDDDYRLLKAKRGGISLQTLKRNELVFDRPRNRWLIPFKCTTGSVSTFQDYRLNGGPKRNIPRLPMSLFGLDRLTSDASKIIYLCEGPFDAIALEYYLGLKRTKYDIVATPGPFQDKWAGLFKGRKVRALFDNDAAGRQHAEQVRRSLGDSRIATDLRILKWPPEFDDGFDINDLVSANTEKPEDERISLPGWIEQNSVKISGAKQLTVYHGRRNKDQDRPIEWVWPHHLRCGTYASFSGAMGTMKSTVMLDLIARYTQGKPMPGQKQASMPAGHVLYIVAEDDRAEAENSFEAAGGNFDHWHVMPARGRNGDTINILNSLEEMEEIIREWNVKPVVIDGQNSVVGDPNISTDMKARTNVSNKLHHWAQRLNIALIGIRNEDVEGRALGAQSMGDIARCVWRNIELERGGNYRYFKLLFKKVSDTPKANYPELPYAVLDTKDSVRRILWEKSKTTLAASLKAKTAKNHTRKTIPLPH